MIRKPPFRTTVGLVHNDGRSVTLHSTRLCILDRPEWYLDYAPGTYVSEDRYETMVLIVEGPEVWR